MTVEFSEKYSTKNGYGYNISVQCFDDLDENSLEFTKNKMLELEKATVLDLGGGFGTHAIKMADTGATITMIDIEDHNTLQETNINFVNKDFLHIKDEDIPENIDLLYSQRAISYISYLSAKELLTKIINKMSKNSAIFISAAGYNAEYSEEYPSKNININDRFDYLSKTMQDKYNITHKVTIYKEKELADLLACVGFVNITSIASPSGNIKATAFKI